MRDTAVPPLDGSRIWPFLFPQLRLSGGNYSWLLGALVLAAVWFGALDVVFDLSLDLVDSLAGLR